MIHPKALLPAWRPDSITWASLLGVAGVGLAALAQLLLAPILKQVLGVDGLGTWMLLQQAFNLCLLAELGATDGAVKVLAESHGTPGWDRSIAASRRLAWITGALVALMCLGVCFGILISGNIPATLMPDAVMATAFLVIWGALRFPLRQSLRCVFARGDVATAGLVELAIGILRPVCALLLIAAGWQTCSAAILGFIIGEALPLVWLSLRQSFPATCPVDPPLLRRMWHLGLGTSAWSLSTVAIPYIITVMLGFVASPRDVAAFQCSTLLGALLVRFFIIPCNSLFPTLVQWRSSGASTWVPARMRKILWWWLGTMVVACTLFTLANEWFVSLWVGRELYAGHPFTACWSLAILGWSLSAFLVLLHRVWCDRLVHVTTIQCLGVLPIPLAFIAFHLTNAPPLMIFSIATAVGSAFVAVSLVAMLGKYRCQPMKGAELKSHVVK